MRSNKCISMNIRVSEDEHNKIKKAAEMLHYAGYSEFVRRTALEEAEKVIKLKEDLDQQISQTIQVEGAKVK